MVHVVLLHEEGDKIHVLEAQVDLVRDCEPLALRPQQRVADLEGRYVRVLVECVGAPPHVVVGQGVPRQPPLLQVSKQDPQVPVRPLRQRLKGHLVGLQALLLAHLEHPLRHCLLCGLPEVELNARVPQRLHFLQVLVVADADDRDLGAFDRVYDLRDPAAIAPGHPVALVHDQNRPAVASLPHRPIVQQLPDLVAALAVQALLPVPVRLSPRVTGVDLDDRPKAQGLGHEHGAGRLAHARRPGEQDGLLLEELLGLLVARGGPPGRLVQHVDVPKVPEPARDELHVHLVAHHLAELARAVLGDPQGTVGRRRRRRRRGRRRCGGAEGERGQNTAREERRRLTVG
mmetsp:Transcript_9988/g.34473  ORF Transcript_9988/g.34473 Transcript_9988/m.34473 type:complete len:345 (-) Transcript_9988:257-1291(-)